MIVQILDWHIQMTTLWRTVRKYREVSLDLSIQCQAVLNRIVRHSHALLTLITYFLAVYRRYSDQGPNLCFRRESGNQRLEIHFKVRIMQESQSEVDNLRGIHWSYAYGKWTKWWIIKVHKQASIAYKSEWYANSSGRYTGDGDGNGFLLILIQDIQTSNISFCEPKIIAPPSGTNNLNG